MGYPLLGKPTPAAFATGVATSAIPPMEGIFIRSSKATLLEHRSTLPELLGLITSEAEFNDAFRPSEGENLNPTE